MNHDIVTWRMDMLSQFIPYHRGLPSSPCGRGCYDFIPLCWWRLSLPIKVRRRCWVAVMEAKGASCDSRLRLLLSRIFRLSRLRLFVRSLLEKRPSRLLAAKSAPTQWKRAVCMNRACCRELPNRYGGV